MYRLIALLLIFNFFIKCNYGQVCSFISNEIPNPSFEGYSCCPSFFSQMSCVDDWFQATLGTSDYFNTCGYVASAITNAGLYPFPDGEGVIGTIPDGFNAYYEYLGVCATLTANRQYTLTLEVAFIEINGFLGTCNTGRIYPPIEINLYGSAACPTTPLNCTACPTACSNLWFVIGRVTYTPQIGWTLLTINFTLPLIVNSIVLGVQCNMPSEYNYDVVNGCYTYFLFDDLNLTYIFTCDDNDACTVDTCID